MISMASSNTNGYTINNQGYSMVTFNMYGTEYINGHNSFGIKYHNTSIKMIPLTGSGWIIV
jgi:hypothetical protein